MPSLLDTLLARLTHDRAQARSRLGGLLENAFISGIDSRGIQLSVPDTRVSTGLARHAVEMSTQGRMRGPTHRRGFDTIIPFEQPLNGVEDMFADGGIRAGSSVAELRDFLRRRTGDDGGNIGNRRRETSIASTTARQRPTRISDAYPNQDIYTGGSSHVDALDAQTPQIVGGVTNTGLRGNNRSVLPAGPQRLGGGGTLDNDFLSLPLQISRAHRNFQQLLQKELQSNHQEDH